MSFERPEWLLLLLVLPLLYWIDRLVRRRVIVVVPALLLWERVPSRRRPEGARRTEVLRFLVLALGWSLLAGALAGPWLAAAGSRTRVVVAVLDRTASLGARHESGGTRFSLGRDRLRAMLTGLTPEDRVLVLAHPGESRPVLESPDRARERIDGLEPSDLPGNVESILPAALAMARQRAASLVVVMSDEPLPDGLAAAAPCPIAEIRPSGPCRNVGIVNIEFGTRQNGEEGIRVALVLRNGSSERIEAPVTLAVDGVESDRRVARLAPDSSALVRLEGPPGEVAQARVESSDDLPADNVARAVRSSRDRIRVRVSGASSDRLWKALRAVDPGIRVEIAAGGPNGEADLWIGSGVASGSRSFPGEVVLIDPPGDAPPLRLGDPYEPGRLRALRLEEMDGVRLGDVTVTRARRVIAPVGAAVLAVAGGPDGEVPLIVRSGRVTVIPFPLEPVTTDWPDWPAFPIFWQRVVSRVASELEAGMTHRALGQILEVDGPGRLVGPDGVVATGAAPGISGEAWRLRPERAGIYRWIPGDRGADRVFALNLLSEGETACSGESGPLEVPSVPAAPERAGRGSPLARVWLAAGAVVLGVYFAAFDRRTRWERGRRKRAGRSPGSVPGKPSG